MHVNDRKHFYVRHTNGGALTITGDVFVNIIDRSTPNGGEFQLPPVYKFGFLPIGDSGKDGALVDKSQLVDLALWLIETFGGATNE